MADRRLTFRFASACLGALLLAGCATPVPFQGVVLRDELPVYAAAENDPGDVDVLWGGTIIGIKEHDDGSEIEVLAYPLNRKQQPDPRAPSEGRFVIRVPAKLQRLDAPEGRFLTVRGRLAGSYDGNVGRTQYRYPIVVDADWVLWRAGFQYDGMRWSVGVGVRL